MYKLHKFYEKIKKIIAYLPLLWQDEDWDYDFLIKLIQFKLLRMKNKFVANNIVSNECLQEICNGIDKTLQYIDNYYDDDIFEKTHGSLPFQYEFKSILNDNGAYNQVTYNSNTGNPLTKREEEIYQKFIVDKYEFQSQQWNAIFDTIRNEGRKWWD